MSTSKTISFRMRAEADRDRTYLLNKAVERYLELNEYHIKLIEKGLRAAKAGKLVSDADVKKMISKMSVSNYANSSLGRSKGCEFTARRVACYATSIRAPRA